MKVLIVSIAGVLVAAVLLLVFGIPANFLVGMVQSRVEANTGYRLRVDGGATVGFWPSPTVLFRDVSVDAGAGSGTQFKVASARISLSLAELLHGRTHITRLTISHPALRVDFKRATQPVAPAASAGGGHSGPTQSLTVDRIVVEDGAISFANGADRLQKGIDHIDLDASLAPAAGQPSATGTLDWAGQALKVGLKSPSWPQGLQGQTIPVEFSLQAPGLLAQPLSASAELRERNSALAINAIAGLVGENSFDGSLKVDFASGKPSLEGDFNFDRLQVLAGSEHGASPPATAASNPPQRNALSAPWSDREVRLDGLNFFTADIKMSAHELDLGSFRFAPIAATATVKRGLLQIKLGHTGLYGGEANGTMSVDASAKTPVQAMQMHLDGVSALPLLSDVADFQSLEGTLRADIDVTAAGTSQRSALSSLDGTVDIHLSNGAVRGIDLAKLMHNLTTTILNGWQQNPADKTPLTDFSAHFRIAKGVATTDDLALSGPVVRMTGGGSVDIAGKSLQLKVDPQLVVAEKDTGNTSQATGLGVPVDITGDWSAPRIYPDVDGILNNPDSVYNQLKAAGKGLFGGSDQSGGNGTLNNLLQGLGNMFNAPSSSGRGGSSGSNQ